WARASRETRPAFRSFSTISSFKSKVSRRHRPFPYNPWLPSREIDDRRLAPDGGRACVHVEVDGLAELLARVRALDRRRFAVDVRARGGDRAELLCEEQCNGMLRNADCNRVPRRD